MTTPRVLAYPQAHPYVDRLDGTAARLVRPDADRPRLPLAYDPDWVTAHADGWDLAHLHFGHEQHPLDQVAEVVRAHRRAGRPVVVTAHDLQIPHLPAGDPAALDLLDAIAPDASAVTTLTEGCAAVLRRRLGVAVEVLPHGPLVPALTRQRARAAHRDDRRAPGHVLVHAGRVRPNAGLAEVVAAAAAALERPGAVRIGVREEDADAVRSLAAGVPAVEVVAGQRLPDADLVRAVAEADALLLPYRWGTHSGLLELAADVGTPVRCTDAGFVAEQRDAALRHPGHPPAPVHADIADDPGDVGRIDVAALRLAITTAPAPGERAASAARAQDDRAFLEGHVRVYRRVVAEGGVAA